MSNVILKGELHTSRADLEEAKALTKRGPDTLIFEGKKPVRNDFDLGDGWFALSVLSFFWILDSVYASDGVVTDLAEAQEIDVHYTRKSNIEVLSSVPLRVRILAAGAFYFLIPASIWIGFVTGSQLTGAYLLFLGMVIPIFIVRSYDLRSGQHETERDIAEEIVNAVDGGKEVLALVGAGHLNAITEELPERIELEVRSPCYGPWTLSHLRDIGLPMFKAGLVLFSTYLLSVWVTVQFVQYISKLIQFALLVVV